MAKGSRTNPITKWLHEHKGHSIAFVAKNTTLPVSSFYNFCKGISRNEKIEKIFIEAGVPTKIINETFENIEKDNTNV